MCVANKERKRKFVKDKRRNFLAVTHSLLMSNEDYGGERRSGCKY
jgi:hypothetical protein